MTALKGAKLFTGSTGKEFAEKMCKYLGGNLSLSEVITFSEGNTKDGEVL